MPIRIKITDIDFGQRFYLKTDELQNPYTLVAIVVNPGNAIRFRLSFCGEVVEVWDFEASTEKDEAIIAPNKDVDSEEDEDT